MNRLKEKTTATLLIVLLSMAFGLAPVLAVKPSTKLMGAEKVPWNLSGDVMPSPYGDHDIDGSDYASKLIVNQPNGAVKVVITGVMNGLHPNADYTVYLAKSYTPGDPSTWGGLFTNTVPPFTFTADQDGSASWHLNLRYGDFPDSGVHTLSVWFNELDVPGHWSATVLISDNFQVTVD